MDHDKRFNTKEVIQETALPPSQAMTAWNDHALPLEYQEWRANELRAFQSLPLEGKSVLDYCCGDGRIINVLLGQITTYAGCDIDEASISKAKQRTRQDSSRVAIQKMDWREYAENFKEEPCDIVCCLGNTSAALPQSLSEQLQIMKETAREFLFISVIAKGTLNIRLKYYDQLQLPYTVDSKTETIHSPIWGASGAFSQSETLLAAQKVGLQKVRIVPVKPLGFALVAFLI